MTTSELPPIEKNRSATMAKGSKMGGKVADEDLTGDLRVSRSASVSDKRARYDRNGNPITTVIGTFSIETRR